MTRSVRRNDVGMTRKEPPRAIFVLPDIRETPPDWLSGPKARARGIADRHDRFQPHENHEGAIATRKFDPTLESGEVDDPGAHEHIEYVFAAGHNPVIGRIDGELRRPQPFERFQVTPESGDAFLIVQQPYVRFVSSCILSHGEAPLQQADHEEESDWRVSHSERSYFYFPDVGAGLR
jgi:hypothetical protein